MTRCQPLAALSLLVLALACNSTPERRPPAPGGSGGGAAGSGAAGSGGESGSGGSGATGGTAGAGGSAGAGGGGAGGSGGAGGVDAAPGGSGGTPTAGTGGSAPDTGAGEGPSAPSNVCAPPYSMAEMSCHAMCPRCSAGNPTLDKIYGLTPQDGTMKVSQDYNLDSEKIDPDSTPSVIKAAIYQLKGALYWVSDMDVDCDGRVTPGKCDKAHDCCFMMDTALHANGHALAAAETPYVVVPNNFKGLSVGSVVAVVYGGKIQYTVIGDTGPPDIIGEASYATAEKLGINPSATDGGINGRSVTYIAFTGAGTSPKNAEDQAETTALGERLMAKFLQDNAP